MSVLKTAGRADLAAAYKALAATPNNFMMAFGEGETWWGGQQQVLLDIEDDAAQIATEHVPVTAVSVRSANGVTLYQSTIDYTVNLTSGAIVRLPGGSIAEDASIQVTYTANVPQPDLLTQALVAEVGRVPVSSVLYIVPFAEAEDPEANFVVIEGTKYALMADPTRMLLFQAHINASDGVGNPIREYGLFSRCIVDPDLPEGQVYFEPADIVDGGVYVIAKHRSPVPHDGTVGLDMSIIIEL